jgi:glycerol-3-phosphate dehydrogenase
MKRELSELTSTTYDLLIIGGGINGACAAWDASLRGLSVAIIDKGDFGAATSANSLKIIHGGLRYLQKLDIARMRVFIHERSTLARIAPHFIHPIPCLIPTYGHYKQGREIMRLVLKMNDLIGFDRNRFIDVEKIIPRGRIISKEECLRIFPYFCKKGLTGGAIWYDCQVSNSERLTLSFLLSAAKAGANLANYIEVEGFIKNRNKICGVNAVDVVSEQEIEIKAHIILNATGPWAYKIVELYKNDGSYIAKRSNLALAVNLVSHQSIGKVTVGVQSKTPKENDPVCGGNRFLFMSPWGKSTLFGTSYKNIYGNLDSYVVYEEVLQELINEFNEACPDLGLSFENISFYHRGFIPISNNVNSKRHSLLLEHDNIIDHAITDGISGLISIIGVKYTTGRYVAEKAVDLIYRKLGYTPPPCKTTYTPIYGGGKGEHHKISDEHIAEGTIDRLSSFYGSRYGDVLIYAKADPLQAKSICEDSPVLRCEILNAIRAEMAVKLSDVVFRRTDLGTSNCPPIKHLKVVAKIMADELGWDENRQAEEINEVLGTYSPLKVMIEAA